MTGIIEISWTSANIHEAKKIAEYLVVEKWVACAQIIPNIESVFIWNQQLEKVEENKILLKTRKENFEPISDCIKQMGNYTVPEITCIEIVDGHSAYLNWVRENTRSHSKVLSIK